MPHTLLPRPGSRCGGDSGPEPSPSRSRRSSWSLRRSRDAAASSFGFCFRGKAASDSTPSSGEVELIGYCKRTSFVFVEEGAMTEEKAEMNGVPGDHEIPSCPPEAPGSRTSVPAERMDSEAFERFVHEANVRCSTGTRDQFADFVRQNREGFAQLLEDSASRLGGSLPRPFADRDSGVFTDQDGWTAATSSSSESNLQGVRKWDDLDWRSSKETELEGLLRRSPLLGRGDTLFKTLGLCDAVSEPQLRPKPRPFSDFPRECQPSSGVEDIQMNSRMSSSFHFTTTRTRFEYCGETNTFRFNNQKVCDGLESSYDSLSESEDEDEESPEESRSIEAPSDTSSLKEDSLDTTTAPSPHSETAAARVAREILTTEQTYVGVLHLLDQVFAFRVDQENRAHAMFPQSTLAAMFANLKSLYQLHHNFLLPRLGDRIASWDKEPRVGDIMKDFAPFLKMYAEYVRNYDQAVHLISSWYTKQPRFAAIVDDVHRMPDCGNLTLQHHMLTPVQRVPRYQLLLKEYLKRLPEGSPDKMDTEKALELVSTAADHANEAMKKIDKFKKLLEIQEMVGGVVDLVSPTRELLREGKITKISARSSDHQERHMFVFNDLVLLCSQRLMSNRVVSGPCYRVRARLELDGLLVQDGDNLETPNSFYIKNTGRSIELCAPSPEEKLVWMQILAKAAHDLKQRKSSLKVGVSGQKTPEGLELGQRAPVLVKAESVSRCMKCSASFSAFSLRWKHHCHACGIVACSKCLSHKVKLAFDNGRPGRVCGSCQAAILQNDPDSSADQERDPGSPGPCFSPPVVSSYLRLKTNGRGAWTRRWFALHSDFVLYSFRSEEDELPLTSMPVPGYSVAPAEKGDGVDAKSPIFKLFHQKKTYFFQAADMEEVQRWIAALDRASRAEEEPD